MIYCLTGQVRATGSTILCYMGAADTVVAWRILSGGGALVPLTNYTDEYGRAYCRYEAGGYAGAVRIEVEHGT